MDTVTLSKVSLCPLYVFTLALCLWLEQPSEGNPVHFSSFHFVASIGQLLAVQK